MGRYIQYDHSKVTGYHKDEKGVYHHRKTDDFVHLRHQDPILMACRRSQEMAQCDKFDVETAPVIRRWVDDKTESFTPMRAMAVPEMDW